MRRTFELFHLSLKSRSPLFETVSQSREDWLRVILADQFQFDHRTEPFTWLPVSVDEVIIGKVMRESLERKFLPPEEGGDEVEGEEWRAAIVVIDPAGHEDGQKASVERRTRVGRPRAILASLLEETARRGDGLYSIEAKQIWDVGEFFAWASARGNIVRHIKFDFVVPNMWGASSDLEKDLKETGESTGAQKVQVELRGPDGVRTDNDLVREGVEYAARGSGIVSAKSQDNESFNSSGKAKVEKLKGMPDISRLRGEELTRWVRRILGREQDAGVDGAAVPNNNPRDS